MGCIKFNVSAFLVHTWTTIGVGQFDSCNGKLSWLNDGYCDVSLNIPDCAYDGGDCCECTCTDGPVYMCGKAGYACDDPACIDPVIQAEFPDCPGNMARVKDGSCDADTNNVECGFDGGDCCLCTCVSNGNCKFSNLDCVDPSAGEHLDQCQPPLPSSLPCAEDVQKTWLVGNSEEARAMAEAVNCSGGTFDVEWKGLVPVDTTIYISGRTVLNITGVGLSPTATLGGASQMRLLTVINASFYMSDMKVISGSAVVGGAIAASASNVTLTRTHFAHNRASGMGGAIYAINSSSVFLNGSVTTFQNNSAAGYGGAFFLSRRSAVRFDGDESNILYNAAGVSGGAFAIDESELRWQGKTLFANNTSGSSGGAIYAGGGRISWNGSTEFARNMAVNGGGALFTSFSSTVSWGGVSSFLENSANVGGAVFTSSASSLRWDGPRTMFTHNTATVFAGAVFVSESRVSWSGHTRFDFNQANSYGGALGIENAIVSWDGRAEFVSNTATGDVSRAGAVWAAYAAEVSWYGETLFFNNSAGYGGAVTVMFGSSVWWDGPSTTFALNSVTSSNASSGGAISVSESNISWHGETTFENNRASGGGGAIFVDIANLSWGGNTAFVFNTVDSVTGTNGTFVGVPNADISIGGATLFSNNSAQTGGAIFVLPNCNVRWSGPNTTFIQNEAISATGGAISIIGSSISWSGATYFYDNFASSGFGGGFHAWNGTRIEWSGETTFTRNKAINGGAMYVSRDVIMKWAGLTTFSLNEAEEGGGAIGSPSVDASAEGELLSSLYIAGTTVFIDNVSKRDGGAIYLQGTLSIDFDLTANVTFQQNIAVAAGGAVYMVGMDIGLTFLKVSFVSNSAQLGGAIYSTSSGNAKINFNGKTTLNPSTFDQCSFVGNKATATGGAIQSAAGQDYVVDSSFEGNSARAGGALFLAGTSYFYSCSFIDNESDEGAGAAISNIGYVASMRNSSFVDNVYNCASGTFRAYNMSDNIYETLCVDCDALCEECYFKDSRRVPYCEGVMVHSTSKGGSTTIEQIEINSGYWRATTSSKTILACMNPGACKGGFTGMSSYCKNGYQGPYCSICSQGYTEGPGFTCDKCSNKSTGVVLAVVIFAATAIAVVVLVRYLVSGDHERTRRGLVEKLMRVIPFQSAKITIVAWQILTQFASVANVTFPSVYQRFLNGVMVLNFDISWVFSMGCVIDLDFYDRLLFATLGPIAAVTALSVTYGMAVRQNRGSDGALAHIRHKHISAVLLLTFLVYSSVSSILFQTFSCDSLDDGKNYLRADYRVQCDSPKHAAFTIYSGFMAVLYACGIPALYAGLLFKDRRLLMIESGKSTRDCRDGRTDHPQLRPTSQLWKPYKPNRFYYEVIECGRRILLTGVVVFIYPNTAAQIAITLVIVFTFAIASEGLNPYSSIWDTWVSRMGHVVVFTSVYVALLLKVDVSQERRESQVVFKALLVFVHACMVMAVVGEALVVMLSLRADRQENPSPRFRRMNWIHNKRGVSTTNCP